MSVLAGCKISTLMADSALDAFMVIRKILIEGKVQISRITKLEIMCMRCPLRPVEITGAPRTGVRFKAATWVLGSEPMSCEERPVFLNVEPSPQTLQIFIFKKNIH